jgi:electron transport complex protein RnfA
MNYLTIVLTSVFSANALLVYGLGICPAFRREKRSLGPQLLALGLVSFLASCLYWLVRTYALHPLAIEALGPVVYAVLIAPLLKYLSRFIASSGRQPLVRIGAAADEAVTSCLVFGLALIVTKADFGLVEALAATLAGCLGYWLALVILDSIRQRLELSDLPPAFRGAPALLLSAGLMAMAFLGLDSALIRNLAR